MYHDQFLLEHQLFLFKRGEQTRRLGQREMPRILANKRVIQILI